MTVLESLRALTNYPIPEAAFEAIGIESGLDLGAELSSIPDRALLRARSRLYLFLAMAPNVSEGGVSISYSASERAYYMNLAKKLAELADDGLIPKVSYGYKGENI